MIIGAKKNMRVEGDHLTRRVSEWMCTMMEAARSPLNVLFFGLPLKYNLIPQGRKAKRLYLKIEDACYNAFLEKEKEENERAARDTEYKPDLNTILGLLVQQNNNLPEGKKMSKYEIAGSVMTFILSGSDTTLNTLITFFAKESSNQSLHQKIMDTFPRKSENSELECQDIDGNLGLDLILKEILRLYSGASSTSFKKFTRDVKVGGYQFRKGDKYIIPIILSMTLESVFPKPLEFEHERFKDIER